MNEEQQVTTATARLTADEIRMCFERVGEYVQRAERLLTRAFEEEHWRLLGYPDWAAYCKGELDTYSRKLPVSLRQSIAVKLKALGASTREIAAGTGTSQMQASRDTRSETNVSVPTDPVDNTEEEEQAAETTPPPEEPEQPTMNRPPPSRPRVSRSRKPQPQVTEDMISTCMTGIKQGLSQTEAGVRLGLKNNSMTLAAAYAVARERLEHPHSGTGGRTKNHNGKTNPARIRELNEARKAGRYTELLKIQIKIGELCSLLESFNVRDYDLRDVELWRFTDISEDLIVLGEWLDRQLSAVLGYMGESDVRAKIAKLRDTGGRTPEEADTARRLADRLEKKLSARLNGG